MPPTSRPLPSLPAERRPVAYWLPVVLWLCVMLYFSSVPDPYAALGGEGTTLSDLLGHFFGFLVLALLVLRWVRSRQGAPGMGSMGWTAMACFAYAVFDELHQMPIPGRYFEWHDIAIDAAGVVVGLMADGLWRLCRRKPTYGRTIE